MKGLQAVSALHTRYPSQVKVDVMTTDTRLARRVVSSVRALEKGIDRTTIMIASTTCIRFRSLLLLGGILWWRAYWVATAHAVMSAALNGRLVASERVCARYCAVKARAVALVAVSCAQKRGEGSQLCTPCCDV